jgi:hypothetical protein
MSDFTPDQTVYLPDGREAIYVMRNGDQHLVRIVREVEGIYDEPSYSYPDDKITPARVVYPVAPVDVWDKQVLAKRQQVSDLDRELTAKRVEIAQIDRNKAVMEKAAAKYPDISDALDFIEGRITHVVQWSGYGGVQVLSVKDALEDRGTEYGRVRVNGMKLLCLFGADAAGKRAWMVNHYRDGSASGWTTIWPARSEGEARNKVRAMVDEVLTAWRSGDEKWWQGRIGLADTLKLNPWLEVPEDWRAHLDEKAQAARQEKIAKLREELAKLEGTQ